MHSPAPPLLALTAYCLPPHRETTLRHQTPQPIIRILVETGGRGRVNGRLQMTKNEERRTADVLFSWNVCLLPDWQTTCIYSLQD